MTIAPGTAQTAAVLTGLFERLRPHLRNQVFGFPEARSIVDITYKARSFQQICTAFARSFDAEARKLSTYELLFAVRKKRRLIARIMLFEILKKLPIRVCSSIGKDMYSFEANVAFAIAVCASQLGEVRYDELLADDLNLAVRGYLRTLHSSGGARWDTSQNEKVITLIAKACRRP